MAWKEKVNKRKKTMDVVFVAMFCIPAFPVTQNTTPHATFKISLNKKEQAPKHV